MDNKRMEATIRTHNLRPSSVGFKRLLLRDETMENMLKERGEQLSQRGFELHGELAAEKEEER